MKSKKIKTKLTTKATKELEEEVEAEMNLPDPSSEKAKAILSDGENDKDEDSQGNDRTASN